MKFTYNWLKKFLNTELSPSQIELELTKLGLEVEGVIDRSKDLLGFKVGYIEEAEPHPNADKLRICKVNDGKEVLQIVCGASNARAGIKVVLSTPGCVIPNGNFAIKLSEIRGVKSNGMLCSAGELLLDLDDNKDGIIELSENATVGDNILKYLGLDDVIYDVSVTPNRGDWLGVYGIARDLAAKNLGEIIKIDSPKFDERFESSVQAKIESDACSFLSLREIKNVQNIASPAWLQNLLKSVDISPISSIVDITNYIAISFARPLHAYDRSKIGNSLCAKNPSGNSKFLALNGKEYDLSPDDLGIEDEKGPRALAGVIGGESSKCDENTASIILESASFDKVSVAKMGRKHGIITDSRSRFERGVDDSFALEYANIATQMIVDICGGEVGQPSIAGKLPDVKEIAFDIKILDKRIGLKASISEMKTILASLGFKILGEERDILTLYIPSWRHDINCPEVVAEEIARIIGYENIPLKEIKPKTSFSRLFTPEQKRLENLRRQVASLGFNEVVTWSFMSSKMVGNFYNLDQKMLIINPISTDLDYMRPSIIPNLLSSLESNIKRSISNCAFFEAGPVFFGLKPEDEKLMISGIISGELVVKSHSRSPRSADLFDVKYYLDNIFSEAGFESSKMRLIAEAPKYYHPGRSGSYKIGNNVVGYFGEIHPRISEIYGINHGTFAFEIFLENIPTPRSKFGKKQKLEISQYQIVTRDFAFLLDEEKTSEELIKLIASIDPLIKNIEIFDVYTGSHVEKGKKSMAFRISLQAYDRTLTDKEIDSISGNLISSIEAKLGGVLRG